MDKPDITPYNPAASTGDADVERGAECGEETEEGGRRSDSNSIPNNLYYNMEKKKRLIIFNHFDFTHAHRNGYNVLPQRLGTKNDVESLQKTFKSLGFDVQIYDDLTRKAIFEVVADLIKEDHEHTSCVAFAILTHGWSQGCLFATDTVYNLEEIINELVNVKLALIPKLLFIQACRGDDVDAGYHVNVDSQRRNTVHIPTYIDFLILRSTEGFVSFRDLNKGSWTIQSLCDVINEHYWHLDLQQMASLVNGRVAYEYVSRTEQLCYDNKKQSVETINRLTKLLKFSKVSNRRSNAPTSISENGIGDSELNGNTISN